jgi:glycosyltransferase involved in cell wall biosynthesis
VIKVLYASRGGDPYGAKNSLLSLIEGLDRSHFSPLLVVPEAGFLSEKTEELGIPARILPINEFVFTSNPLLLVRQAWRLTGNILAVQRLIREQGIDLVHVNSFKVAPPYAIAARSLGIPCIWHCREILMTTPFRKRVLAAMIRSLPNRVIAVSEACAAQFRRAGRGNTKIHVIYNGIDSEAFQAQADGEEVRRELGLAADTPLVGCVGQLIPWKGQDDFVRVAAKVLSALPEARFLIVGREVDSHRFFRASLEELASSLGIEDHVIFTGFRQDVPSLMASMDVFLHCAVQPDPLPRVILEAMALGKPIVATSSGGLPEMIEGGKSGILARPRDVDSLAQGTVSLLSDRKLAAQMGRLARQRVEERFSLTQHVEAVTQLYGELTQEG